MKRTILLFLLLISFVSCEDEITGIDIQLTTEEVIYLSGERVILAGRLHSFQNKIIDHGFQISEEEYFPDPILISLGETSSKGKFIGTFEQLLIGRIYYYRAYADDGSLMAFGEVKEFQTLRPQIKSFSPGVGREDEILKIIGANFTKETRVFFDEIEATIVDFSFESFLEVSIPKISGSLLVKISVSIQDTLMTFPGPFEYIIGKWEKVGEFTNNLQILDPVFIDRQEVAYLGYGSTVGTKINPFFWKIDKETLSWSSLPSPTGGVPVDGPLNFESGFGTGRYGFDLGFFNLTNTSWLLSESEEWIESMELPFSLYKGISVDLIGNTYVLGGLKEDRKKNLMTYRCNSMTKEWEIVSERLPFVISSDEAYFTYLDHFYYLYDGQEIWNFNPVSLNWNKIVDLPFNIGRKTIAIVVDNKAYILGLGLASNKVIEFDLQTGRILEKTSFPGQPGEVNSAFWSYKNNIYVMRTVKNQSVSTSKNMEIWEFDPLAY